MQETIREGVPETREKTRKKTREKTREKIILSILENPYTTISELAEKLSLTIKGVEWQLKKLKQQDIIRRVGPDRGGHWEIVKKESR